MSREPASRRSAERGRGRALRFGAWFLGTLLVSACSGLALARLTTDSPRAYEVLAPTTTVQLGATSRTVDDLAQAFRPGIRALPRPGDDPVVAIRYEAVADGEDLLLRYFVSWADEIHPNPVAHALYAAYRWAYYGGVRDIEYVQLRIDPAAEVSEIRFETSGAADPFTPRPRHVDAIAVPDGSDWVRTLTDEADDDVPPVLRTPRTDPVVLRVVTWNHLLDLVPAGESTGRLDSPPAVPLTDDGYRAAAAARRGHPDDRNVQTPVRDLAGSVGTALFLAAPALSLAAAVTAVVRHGQRRP